MMRPLARLCAVLLLAACQLQTPKTTALGDQPTPIASDSVIVTTLAGGPAGPANPAVTPAVATPTLPAIPVQMPAKTNPRPMPRPTKLAAAPPPVPQKTAAPVTVPPISSEQALCEKSKGQWSEMPSSSGHICVHHTRDSGKSCHKKSDCQGECLATSRTCSPIMPLVGCNDILQPDGSEVTLCLQ